MYRLRVRRAFLVNGKNPEGFVIGTLDELQCLASLPDCIVLSDPYNPPGFPGALPASGQVEAAEISTGGQ